MNPDQLAAVGADLARQADGAKAAIQDALMAGGHTASARAKLQKIAEDIEEHAAQVARLRAEDEAPHERSVRVAAGRIARESVDRMRLTLARVAAPHPPKTLRRGA